MSKIAEQVTSSVRDLVLNKERVIEAYNFYVEESVLDKAPAPACKELRFSSIK